MSIEKVCLRRSEGNWRFACAAFVSLGWLVFGTEARAVSVPDPSLSVLEMSFDGGGEFPGDLYADFDWLDMYAISECGPCGEAYFDLFDPDLGRLVSVDVAYEGAMWFDDENRFYYSDMVLSLVAGSWGERPEGYFVAVVSDLIKTDGGWETSDPNFSGSFSAPEDRLDAFIRNDRHQMGYVGFSGTPQVVFPTKESAYYALGGDFSMTVSYGYEPVMPPVPLPPAALLMLGALGALFTAARRPFLS